MSDNNKEQKKAARADARERVGNRLEKGKNVNISKIAEKSGVSEKRVQKIVNRAEAPSLSHSYFEGADNGKSVGPKEGSTRPDKYFDQHGIDPGKRLGLGEAKDAINAGVSAYNLNRYASNLSKGSSSKAQAFLDKKAGQVSTKMEDYDTATAGGKRFTKADIRYLMSEEGGSHSMNAIQGKLDSYQNDTSVKVGLGAQKFLDKKIAERSKEDARLGATDGQVAPQVPPPTGDAEAEQIAERLPYVDNSGGSDNTAFVGDDNTNTAVGNNKFNDTRNDFANYGTFIGNNNQGVDFSVNIAGGASDNITNTAGYMALNDNAFAKSQAQLSGLGRASQQVEAANLQTNSAQDIANTDYLSRINPMYMGAKATQSQTQLYGDTFKFELPKFEMPVPGKKPEDKTQEIADMYKN